MNEKFIPPEARRMERTIEGEERERFIAELREYTAGLEAALADPDLHEEERTELEAQLEGLKDSLESALAGGDFKV